MSQVKIRWTIGAAGRDPGDIETVERTAFVEGLIANRRVVVLEEFGFDVGVLEPEESKCPDEVLAELADAAPAPAELTDDELEALTAPDAEEA